MMYTTRYRLWTVDPLNTDDEQPVFGTFSLTSAKRIVELYSRRADCDRVAVIRPTRCEVPEDHAWYVRLKFRSDQKRDRVRFLVARDPSDAARQLIARHTDLAWLAVWLFREDYAVGSPPMLLAHREQGRQCFQTTRAL